MKNTDARGHVRGESIYLDDIPEREGTLHAAVYASALAHGNIISVSIEEARAMHGVVAVFCAADVPGENQIGSIIPDEPLLAESQVHFEGQPIAIVVAETDEQARAAVERITVEIEPLPVITDPREAHRQGSLIVPPRSFAVGELEKTWPLCEHVFEGRVESGGQEHLYIETQGAYAMQTEAGHVRIYSSTQGPTAVQRTAARVLGYPMHKIEVDVTRLGGGFGGKEDQASAWASIVAMACMLLDRPVKLVLHRLDDLRMTGKRHPYSSDYKIGLDKDLHILAYQVSFYQNAGAAADLSTAILERTLFHHTNSYFIPNTQATAYCCRTNLPPNTAFRGFGGPQGMYVIESAIAHAAESLGLEATEIQERNLLASGDTFPYGQKLGESNARTSWAQVREKAKIDTLSEEVAQFNAKPGYYKQGLSHMPICFGISFTNKALNQSSALVHIYQDGSVSVSTGAVEMGQGVNTKMTQVAATSLGIATSRVRIETTNTTRVANTSPTAASSGADLNGKAVEKACSALNARLTEFASKKLASTDRVLQIRDERIYQDGVATQLTWESLVNEAYWNRISLTEQAFYATPGIHYDKTQEKGEPFAYYVFGTAIFQVTLDCLRGRYEIDHVEIVHDFGNSINKNIDLGQIEGALVQGIGWMTLEEIRYSKQGHLMSNALSTYKVPDIYSAPKSVLIHHLDSTGPAAAIFRSKAVGEPPLMYGIGAYFAIRNAMRAYRELPMGSFDAPITPEKVLMNLYQRGEQVADNR